MPRIRPSGGPGRFSHTSVGVSTLGDEHDVSDSAAAYLCDERGYFERVVVDVDLSEDKYELVEDGADEHDAYIEDGVAYQTYEDLYELAKEQDIDGRSSMDKGELIDALSED